MNYFLVLLVAVIAVASASSYYDEDHATITFPPERPPLGLFSCNETVVSGCGISTSCESFMDACNDAQRHALVQTVEYEHVSRYLKRLSFRSLAFFFYVSFLLFINTFKT
mmetsp:Transcript_28931/g.32140  ORF Transcript_28931/g.32140 Transcript_28931/m.32140 type:complete len:110 (-) Transcript_28931:335-664(-)